LKEVLLMDWMNEADEPQTQAEWYRAGERYQAIIAAETDGHSCGGWVLTDFDTWTRCLVCPDAGHPDAQDEFAVFGAEAEQVAAVLANADDDGIPF
jgi:hypothetical protein